MFQGDMPWSEKDPNMIRDTAYIRPTISLFYEVFLFHGVFGRYGFIPSRDSSECR